MSLRWAWCAALVALPLAAQAGERFEPEDGKTLLIVGQERGEIARYWKEVGPAGGYMLYGSLPALDGIRSPARGSGCSDSGWMDLGDWARGYPDTVAQVGLYLVDVTERVAAAGEMDAAVEELGRILRESRKPVFLRVGYEFDGPWNHYPPDSYKRASRRIAEILRGRGAGGGRAAPVPSVALVWHSAAYATYEGRPLERWRKETNGSRWLKQGPGLFRAIGFVAEPR